MKLEIQSDYGCLSAFTMVDLEDQGAFWYGQSGQLTGADGLMLVVFFAFDMKLISAT